MTPEQYETLVTTLERNAFTARQENNPEALIYVCQQATAGLSKAIHDWPADNKPDLRFDVLRRLDRIGRRGISVSMGRF